MRSLTGELIGTTTFHRLPVGGGGFVTGISQSDDGLLKSVGTDVYNGYVKGPDDAVWRPIFSSESMDPEDYDPLPDAGVLGDGMGTMGVACARSDSNKLCAAWRGFFWFSSDRALSVRKGNLVVKRLFANTGAQRLWNDKIASHPTDSDTWLLGTVNDGVYYTTDHGLNIQAVAGSIPANTAFGGHPSPYLVAIAPDGTAYIQVQGTGTYRADSVSGSFTLMSDSPLWASNLVVDAEGTVWICDRSAEASHSVKRYRSGSWATLDDGSNVIWAYIAVKPGDTDSIALAEQDGKLGYTEDGLSTVNVIMGTYPPNGIPFDASADVPWLSRDGFFPSKLLWDAADPGKLYCSQGIGVAYSLEQPLTWTPWQWYSETAGIEELVGRTALSIPGDPMPLLGFWDKPIVKVTSLRDHINTPQSATGSIDGIDMAWGFDYAADDPDYVVVSSGYTSDTSGFSENGGRSWTELFPDGFPTGQPGGNGGAVAMNERANQIIIPGNNQRAIYTKNEWGGPEKTEKEEGVDWDYLPIDPNAGGMGNWIGARYIRRGLVTADKARPGVFAIVMNGDNQGEGVQGLHVTTNGCDDFTRTVAGRLDATGDSADYWHCTLEYIPGKSGELLYTTGITFASRLLHFTGDGVTTAKVDVGEPWGITNVNTFTFGAKLDEAQDYPTIYFFGECEGVYGLYRSLDFFATAPALLERFPLGSLDEVTHIEGDMNVFGRVYILFGGSGVAYSEYGKAISLV